MKKSIIYSSALIALICMQSATAEVFYINHDAVRHAADPMQCNNMVFNGGETVTILGHEYNLSEISSMTVEDGEVDAQTVGVVYSDNGAIVTMDAALADYITAEVDGDDVKIIQAETVSDDTCGEITYKLSGKSESGSFYMEGAFKATVELNGLELKNPKGAAIDIQNGKRIKIDLGKDTYNKLEDGVGGKQKGAIVCKGHIEFKGKGKLDVTGNTSHAIYAKEYVSIKNSEINVISSVKDGVNCAQYFTMESGTLNILNPGDDGIQVSFKDDADREAEDTGIFTLDGGNLNISVTAEAAKCIKADGGVVINDGEIVAQVSGNGIWDDSKLKTKASSCISTDENLTINGGTLNLKATGSGGKGMSSDGETIIHGGNIHIETSGGILVYSNGSLNHNYTGNTDRVNSDYKSSPKGIKADSGILIDGGVINVKTTGNGGEGIESKGELTINYGTILVDSYDDSINSSSHMYINGGDITVVARHNDGLDSNGNLYINGGRIRAFGASSPECGIDANEEEGYSVYFTGGELLAAGGNNSVPKQAASTQAYITFSSSSIKAGTTVTVKSGDTVLTSFVVPDNYSGSGSTGGGWGGGWGGGMSSGNGALITCPGLESGKSYTIEAGSSTYTATATLRSNSNRPF